MELWLTVDTPDRSSDLAVEISDDLTVGVDIVERHLEVFPDGLEERGPVEQPGNRDERAIRCHAYGEPETLTLGEQSFAEPLGGWKGEECERGEYGK